MKKIFLLGVLALVGWAGHSIYQKLGPAAAPFRAYQQHATAVVQGGAMASKAAAARFGAAGNVPDVTAIEYELESQQEEGEGRVRIVAVQHVQRVYRDGVGNPASRPKYSTTRHSALVERVGDRWKVTEFDPL